MFHSRYDDQLPRRIVAPVPQPLGCAPLAPQLPNGLKTQRSGGLMMVKSGLNYG